MNVKSYCSILLFISYGSVVISFSLCSNQGRWYLFLKFRLALEDVEYTKWGLTFVLLSKCLIFLKKERNVIQNCALLYLWWSKLTKVLLSFFYIASVEQYTISNSYLNNCCSQIFVCIYLFGLYISFHCEKYMQIIEYMTLFLEK